MCVCEWSRQVKPRRPLRVSCNHIHLLDSLFIWGNKKTHTTHHAHRYSEWELMEFFRTLTLILLLSHLILFSGIFFFFLRLSITPKSHLYFGDRDTLALAVTWTFCLSFSLLFFLSLFILDSHSHEIQPQVTWYTNWQGQTYSLAANLVRQQ